MNLQVISHHQVQKTRKPHQCWGCTKKFPVGSSLWVCVTKGDEIARTYWCDRCQEVIDSNPNHQDHLDGYLFGELTGGEE